MDLDYKTSGLQPSDFSLVAARPSMGKTAFVLNMAQYMAFRKDKSVAIFSLEMSKAVSYTHLLDYFRGRALVLINKGATPQDRNADLLIQKPIGQIFSQIKAVSYTHLLLFPFLPLISARKPVHTPVFPEPTEAD